MKNFIVSFSVFMMWAVFGMWYYSCVVKEVCDNESGKIEQTTQENIPITETVQEPLEKLPPDIEKLRKLITSDSLSIIDDQLTSIYSYPLAPEIRINSPHVGIPQTSSVFMADIMNYMNEHPQEFLIIYAAYDENEFSADGKENLGLTRANYIRNLLIDKGMNPSRIKTDAISADLNFIQNEVFKGGILLQVKQHVENENISEDEKFNKILYANFDVNTFKPNQEIDDYAAELKQYLEENPQKIVIITGHTDDVGEVEANDWIGMERAKSVRDYLRFRGIDESRMKTFSKGESEPMVENISRENRAKNRRIEIKIN